MEFPQLNILNQTLIKISNLLRGPIGPSLRMQNAALRHIYYIFSLFTWSQENCDHCTLYILKPMHVLQCDDLSSSSFVVLTVMLPQIHTCVHTPLLYTSWGAQRNAHASNRHYSDYKSWILTVTHVLRSVAQLASLCCSSVEPDNSLCCFTFKKAAVY